MKINVCKYTYMLKIWCYQMTRDFHILSSFRPYFGKTVILWHFNKIHGKKNDKNYM